MPRRIRHHVNPLKLEFVATRAAAPALPAGRPVEVELGCGDAHFLFERAAQRPGAVFVGVEIRRELVDRVNRRAAREGAPVLAVFANVQTELGELFPPRGVERFYLNFPDPWFKRRHHKRRVLSQEVLRTLHRQLAPGGEVFFQTDVFDLALDALEALEAVPELFENQAGEWSFARANPWGARSKRERQSEKRGRRVWRLRFRARGPGPPVT